MEVIFPFLKDVDFIGQSFILLFGITCILTVVFIILETKFGFEDQRVEKIFKLLKFLYIILFIIMGLKVFTPSVFWNFIDLQHIPESIIANIIFITSAILYFDRQKLKLNNLKISVRKIMIILFICWYLRSMILQTMTFEPAPRTIICDGPIPIELKKSGTTQGACRVK